MESYQSCKICKNDILLVNETYSLSQCQKCEFIFHTKIYSQNELIEVYDDLYNNHTNAIYSNHSNDEYQTLLAGKKVKVGRGRSKMIKKTVFNSNCRNVLEIGSGVGLVATYIAQNKPNIRYTGIELDLEAYKKSQNLKLNTFNADFTYIKNLDDTFDVIMLWEVIEHLQDLNVFLELAYSKLNHGGKIILSTPNYNKIFNYPDRQQDQIFQSLPPIHLNFFTIANIEKVFKLHQFQNCKAELKKWPYFEWKQKRFYYDVVRTVFNLHQGTTIYFEATKM